MPNRQSADMSPSASARSRFTIASKSRISFGLVWCVFSQPLAAHCFKLTLVTVHENPRGRKHRSNEVILTVSPFAELGSGVSVGVDGASVAQPDGADEEGGAHEELLINWFRAKGEVSSGAVEGLNNKIRVVARRS